MVLKLRCNSRTTIVNKLTSIPPTRAQSTMLHVLEFSLVCSCFFKDPKAIPFSTFLCIWFFLFLNNHPIRFLLFRLSSSTSFCPPQLSGPQSQGSDSFEHAQVTNGSEQGEHFSWPGIFFTGNCFFIHLVESLNHFAKNRPPSNRCYLNNSRSTQHAFWSNYKHLNVCLRMANLCK